METHDANFTLTCGSFITLMDFLKFDMRWKQSLQFVHLEKGLFVLWDANLIDFCEQNFCLKGVHFRFGIYCT